MKVKIIRIGNSKGIIIPNYLLKRLSLKQGDSLYLTYHTAPPRLIINTPEGEMENLGLSQEERQDIDNFLKIYRHLF